jgi:hypothetical protein
VRAFDARTLGTRERDLMAEIAALRRAAVADPSRADALFDAACALLPVLPLKVQIQTTTRCNAACEMCPYPLVTAEPGFAHSAMDETRFAAILDQLRGGDVERLSLFLMNEPLLDRRLPSWIRRARAALPATKLGLFSNGAALDIERAHALADAGLDELCVSVHGFDPATYERVMAGLSYARVMRNLDEVLAAADAGALGALQLHLVTGDLPEIARTRELAPLRYQSRVLLKAFSNERAAVGVAPGLPSSIAARAAAASPSPDGTDSPDGAADAPCQRVFVKLYVLANGDCVLCNVDWRRTVVLGRVGDPGGATIADVWRGERYTEIRREHFCGRFTRAAICARCDYARVVDRE